MKSQNDLIWMIAAVVVCLGVGLYAFFNKRTVTPPAAPQPVVTTPAKPKEGAVVMANGLGGSGSTISGGPGGSSPAGGGSANLNMGSMKSSMRNRGM